MILDKLIRLCLYVTILAVPLAFDPRLHHPFVLEKVFILRFIVSCGMILWGVKIFLEGRVSWVKTELNMPILAFLIVGIIATAFSKNPEISLVGSEIRNEGLLTLLTNLALFFLSLHFLLDMKRVPGWICLAGFVAACYGIIQRLGGDPITWNEPVWSRVTSTLGQPNALGAYLAMVLPLSLTFAMNPDPRQDKIKGRGIGRRVLGCGCFLVVLIALILTGSRGGWLGAGAALLLFGILTMPRLETKARRVAFVCIILTLLVTGAFSLHPGLSPLRRIASTIHVERNPQGHSISFDGTARERLTTWKASWRLFEANPWIGVGPEMMRQFFPRFLATGDPETEADRAHNFFLQEAVTKGIPGVAVAVWLLVTLFWSGKQGFSRNPSGENRIVATGFLCACFGYIIQGLVGFGLHTTTSLFWVSAAAVARLSVHEEKTVNVRGGITSRVILLILLSSVIIPNAVLAIDLYRADLEFGRSVRLMKSGRMNAALQAGHDANRIYPSGASYRAELGLSYYRAGKKEGESRWISAAERWMAGAVGMDPEDGHLRSWLGMIMAERYRASGDAILSLKASEAYQEAIQRLPRNPSVYVNLSNLLVDMRISDKALHVCKNGLDLNPGSVEILMTLGRIHQIRGENHEAELAFRRVTELDPASIEAYEAIGRILFEREDFEKSAQAFRTASILEPGNAVHQNDLGSALYKAGRYGEASQAFHEPLRLNPGDLYANEFLEASMIRDSTGQFVLQSGDVPRLPVDLVIDLRDPGSRAYLKKGWSYLETWGTWGIGDASEVVFSLKSHSDRRLVVRATAHSSPDRQQTMDVYLNSLLLDRWTFKKTAWTWETFQVRIPAIAFRSGANLLSFRYGQSESTPGMDQRPLSVAFERIAFDVPPLSDGAEIDMRDPRFRPYLRTGWSYTETWGTWGIGDASFVIFPMENISDRRLVVRATGLSTPDRSQTMDVYLNDRFLVRWTFVKPTWEWETFQIRIPAGAFVSGTNRFKFQYSRKVSSTGSERRPLSVGFERIALEREGQDIGVRSQKSE